MLPENAFALCLIEVALCGLSSGTSLENHTQNLVVKVGRNVSIECRIHFTELSSFEFVPVNSVTPVRILLNSEIAQPMRSRYRINKRTSGQNDFIIDFIDRKHAGKYVCKPFHSGVQQTTYLTVIDSDPVCEANSSLIPVVENDQIYLSCKINSTGFMIPSMKCTKNNNVINTITVINVTTNETITTTSSIALQLQPQDNNATIECTTSFQWPNGSQENIPEYKHIWKHAATVLYGVRNITIQPNTSNFQYGQQLTCFADGNPEPSYIWTHINTSHTWSGSVLPLDDSLSPTVVHVFQCTAQNSVEGKNKTVSKSVSFYINARVPGYFGGWIAFAIGGSASIIVILLLICCIFCPNKAKTWLIIRLSSLQRKLNHNPDVLPRQSSSRDEYVGGPLYASSHSRISAETNGFKNDSHAHGSNENDASTTDAHRRPNRKENFVGDDGTVYLDHTGAAPDGRTGPPFRSPPAFTQVAEYASIDHTRRVPPPPGKY